VSRNLAPTGYVCRYVRALLMLTVAMFPARAVGQDRSAPVVEVFLDQSFTIPFADATQVLVVDENICRAEIAFGLLKIDGLARGETVVLVWRNASPESLIVRVEPLPPPPVEERPSLQELDGMGHGQIGTLVHVATASSSGRSLSMVTPFAWTEGAPTHRFAMNGQLQHSRAAGHSDLAVDALSAQWTRGSAAFTILDFTTSLDGGALARITPSSRIGVFSLRGADLTVARDKNSYELFAGTTLPLFAASRQLAGVTVTRQQNARTYIDATTAGVSAPQLIDGARVARQSDIFQTLGVTERLSDRAAVQVRGGAGTSGLYGQAASSWQSERLSGFVRATGSSPSFGLNELQLLYAPRVDLQTGATLKASSRLSTSIGYSHTETEATPLFPAHAISDYVSGNVSVAVARNHTLFTNAVWNRNVGGLGPTGQLTGRRLDIGLGSRIGRFVTNDVQFSAGALADPLQLASRGQFTVRDTLSVATGRRSLSISVAHDRLSPSLVARLRDQLNLLAPGLQSLFLDDPIAFIESPQMPSEVRRLLASLEPIDTQVVVAGQFGLGSRFTIGPTASYQHTAQSSSGTNIGTVGYALTWRMTPTLDLTSSVSNALIFDPRRGELARTTIFALGLRKTLNGEPRWIAPVAGYRIRGRVFRDLNLNGADDQREAGVAGITIRLGDQRAVRTDERGRFEFSGLSAGEYHVLMALDQFSRGVRVTTPVDPVLRLYEHRVTEVNFGVVNFSRLVGNVFNDYALDGVRQGDAPGLRQIAVVIAGDDTERRLVTDAAGDFEISDLPPGHYQLLVDGATLPGNYQSAKASVDVDLAPSTTVTISLPVRALRSIEGHVYWRTARDGGDQGGHQPEAPSVLRPLKGVKVMAHGVIVATDENGRFVLRDLPAGDVFVSVVPNSQVPPDVRIPAGRLRMPVEPTQIENATIVIDNPRLLEYLIDRVDAGSK
jgi:SdrD B-like domain